MLKKLFLFVLSLFILAGCGNSTPKLYPLPANSVVLAYGDSLTFGTGTNPENSYPAVLEKLIGYTVINAGKPGEETSGSLARLNGVLAETHPHLVIVCLGGNDMLRRRDLASIKDNLKKLIQTIKQTGAQVMLLAVPQPNLGMRVPDFYLELADELHVPIDTSSLPQLLANEKFKSDQIHLNQEGYTLLAQNIANFLVKAGAVPVLRSSNSAVGEAPP